jgi:hypothetical protein
MRNVSQIQIFQNQNLPSTPRDGSVQKFPMLRLTVYANRPFLGGRGITTRYIELYILCKFLPLLCKSKISGTIPLKYKPSSWGTNSQYCLVCCSVHIWNLYDYLQAWISFWPRSKFISRLNLQFLWTFGRGATTQSPKQTRCQIWTSESVNRYRAHHGSSMLEVDPGS